MTHSSGLRRGLEAFVGIRFLGGNAVRRLKNGVEIFPAMLRAVRLAQHRIDFVTFVYWTGDIARQMADALSERARAGVEVRVLLDAVGAFQMAEGLIDQMTESGAEVAWFRPVARWKVWETDHRTHRKILVVDNQVAFTGGVGVAAEWEGDARNSSEWRETHFELRGPVVDGLRAAFLADWRDTGGEMYSDGKVPEAPPEAGSVTLGVVDASAQIELNTAARTLETILDLARTRVWIGTPYFNPTSELTRRLIAAVDRGVEVRVMIPGKHIDKRVALISAQEQAGALLRAGVWLHRFEPSMYHVKLVLADDFLSMFGSVNFNERSLYKDEEVAVVALDAELNATLANDYLDDMDRCTTITDPAQFERSWGEVAVAKAIKPFESEM